jgi:hypothetical protein
MAGSAKQRGRPIRHGEAQVALGVGGISGREDLESDGPVEAGVAGLVPLAHAAGADRGDDFTGPEECAAPGSFGYWRA